MRTILLTAASIFALLPLCSCEEKNPELRLFADELKDGNKLSKDVVCTACGDVIHPYEIDTNNDGIFQMSETSVVTGIYSDDRDNFVLGTVLKNTKYFPNLEHIIVENCKAPTHIWAYYNPLPKLKCINIQNPSTTEGLDGWIGINLRDLPELEVLQIDLSKKRGKWINVGGLRQEGEISFPNLKILKLYHSQYLPMVAYANGICETINTSGLMPNLEELACQLRHLEYLDLSGNQKLVKLDCSNNKLSELNLSHNPNLVYLDIRGNLISELDLSNNIELETVLFTSLSKLTVSSSQTDTQWFKEIKENNPEMEIIIK